MLDSCTQHAHVRHRHDHRAHCTYDIDAQSLDARRRQVFAGAREDGAESPVDALYSEDRHSNWQRKDIVFHGVFDGHNGASAADCAAAHMPDFVVDAITSAPGDRDQESFWKVAFSNAFQKCDEHFLSQHPGTTLAGTTATVAITFSLPNGRRFVATANVGDSSGMLCCDADGNGEELTIDHTPKNLKEAQRVVDLGGLRRKGPRVRCAGCIEELRPRPRKLKQYLSSVPHVRLAELKETHKFILLATDGFWGWVGMKEASQLAMRELERYSNVSRVAEVLTKEAYVRHSVDNIGVLLVMLR